MSLSQAEIDWAFSILKTDMEDELCVDNIRIADLDDPVEVSAYETIRDDGCCGSYDRRLVHPETGKAILVGCNYGH